MGLATPTFRPPGQWERAMTGSDSQATWQQITKLALSIAAVVGIVIVPRLPPLGVSRPNVESPVENRYVSSQSADARLWQDPFEAVDAERERRRTADRGDAKATELEASRTRASAMREDIVRQLKDSPAPPLVLLTFVPGGPYPENAESRRRTRYATLSGLRAAGLIPVDAEHIGYFETDIDARRAGLPSLIVYEWLRVPSSEKRERLDQVLLLWLDERIFGSKTVQKTAVLLREMGVCAGARRRIPARMVMLGPAESGSLRSLVDAVRTVPIADVACVSPTFVLSTATVPDDYVVPGRLLDPGGARAANSDGTQTGVPVRDTMGSATVEQWLGGAGLRFSRVLPTDDMLMGELMRELEARRIDLRAPGTRVAILSEWDTLYGRRGAELVSAVICQQQVAESQRSWCDGRVQLFEYPRGLDGVVPGREAKKPAQPSDKTTVIPGLPRGDPGPGERAEGSS